MGRQLLLTNFLTRVVPSWYNVRMDFVLYWILFFIGHCSLLDIVLYWILFFIGSCSLLDFVLYWILFFIGHCSLLDLVLYWILFFIHWIIGENILVTQNSQSEWKIVDSVHRV